jgi:hypothetical protein
MRSAWTVLPGDDVEEFEAMRREQYDQYQPLTREEARCLDLMVSAEWEMARCRRWRAQYNANHEALLYDEDGRVRRAIEPDPHYWRHRSSDCLKDENALERQMHRSWRRLLALQDLRRKGLLKVPLDGAANATPRSDESGEASEIQPVATGSKEAEKRNPPEPEISRRPASHGAARTAAVLTGDLPSFSHRHPALVMVSQAEPNPSPTGAP